MGVIRRTILSVFKYIRQQLHTLLLAREGVPACAERYTVFCRPLH